MDVQRKSLDDIDMCEDLQIAMNLCLVAKI